MTAKPEYDISTVEQGQWNALLQSFRDATVFHRLEWLQVVCAVHRVKIVLVKAEKEGRCIAVWPYLEMKKGPLRVIGSPLPGWSTAYLGPLFAADVDANAVLSAFLAHKLFRWYAFFACKVLDRNPPVDLGAHGFSTVMKFDTYRVDLTLPKETLWDNLKSECRTRIRKAEKLGIEVREETTPQFIDDYWAMSIETFQKSKIQPTHNKQFVQEMWNQLQPAGALHVISAFLDGQRTGSLVLPFDDRTMYYWGGASFLKYRDLPAHNLLHWHAIGEAKQRGLMAYDFISTIGGPGRFKKTFGPQTVDMATHWERSPSRLMAALKKRYQNYLLKRRRIEA